VPPFPHRFERPRRDSGSAGAGIGQIGHLRRHHVQQLAGAHLFTLAYQALEHDAGARRLHLDQPGVRHQRAAAGNAAGELGTSHESEQRHGRAHGAPRDQAHGERLGEQHLAHPGVIAQLHGLGTEQRATHRCPGAVLGVDNPTCLLLLQTTAGAAKCKFRKNTLSH
jgi:hypothetical protein